MMYRYNAWYLSASNAINKSNLRNMKHDADLCSIVTWLWPEIQHFDRMQHESNMGRDARQLFLFASGQPQEQLW